MLPRTMHDCPNCRQRAAMYLLDRENSRYRCGRCGIHALAGNLLASEQGSLAAEALKWLRTTEVRVPGRGTLGRRGHGHVA